VFARRRTYMEEVLVDRPVMYMPCDEPDGGNAADLAFSDIGSYSSGFTFNNVLMPPGLRRPGRRYAHKFASARITVPNNSRLNITGPVTFEAWIYPTNASNSAGEIVAGGNDGAGNGAYDMYLDCVTPKVWLNNAYTGTAVFTMTPTGPTGGTFAVNNWYHVVMSRDAANACLGWWNGQLLANTASATAIQISNQGIWIGEVSSGGSPAFPFDGCIVHAAVYNYALSPSRVLAHYIAGIREQNWRRNEYLVKAPAGGSQNANPGFISSGTVMYTPTLQPGAATIHAPFIAAGTVMYGPSLAYVQTAAVPFITAATQMFTPQALDEATAVGTVSASIDLG
jgi:hypothetical protein